MKKSRLLTIVSVGLLLINLALVFSLLTKPRMGPPREKPNVVIIDKLGLDAEQQIAYEALINKHVEQVKAHSDRLRQLKNELYKGLSEKESSVNTEKIIAEIGNAQKLIENEHYKHFEEIKKLCRPDQIERFNELTADISRLFSRPPLPNGK